MGELIRDLLLPETDRGAVTQWIVMALLWSLVLFGTRHLRQEYRVFLVRPRRGEPGLVRGAHRALGTGEPPRLGECPLGDEVPGP